MDHGSMHALFCLLMPISLRCILSTILYTGRNRVHQGRDRVTLYGVLSTGFFLPGEVGYHLLSSIWVSGWWRGLNSRMYLLSWLSRMYLLDGFLREEIRSFSGRRVSPAS